MGEVTEIIKQKIDLVSYIERFVPLKKTGRNVMGLCPFHREKTGSFFVSPERQTWHCFGCNKGGDIFAFLMEKEGVDFRTALETLAKETNTPLDDHYQKDEFSNPLKACEAAAEYYHMLLLKDKNQPSYQYLTQKRRITPELIDKFNLGFSPDSWQLTGEYLIGKGFSEKDLLEAGLIILKENSTNGRSWYDRFRGRLMFPIADKIGRVIGFSARTIDPKDTSAKYINSPETIIFKKSDLLFGYHLAKESIHRLDYVVVVEGQLDVISMHQVGVTNVVAPQGSAFTENQANLIGKLTKRMVLLFDADDAGKKATLRTLEVCLRKGFEVKVAQLINAKDPDEAAHKDISQLKKDLKNTQDFLTYLLQIIEKDIPKEDPNKGAKITHFILPYLAGLPNRVQQETAVNELANRIQVSSQSIFSELQKTVQSPGLTTERILKSTKKRKLTREESLWYELLAMLMQLPPSLERDAQIIEVVKPLFSITAPDLFAEIASRILKMLQERGKIDYATLNENTTDYQQKVLDRLALKTLGVITDNEELFLENFEKIAQDIEIVSIKKNIRDLAEKSDSTNLLEIKKLTERLKSLID